MVMAKKEISGDEMVDVEEDADEEEDDFLEFDEELGDEE